jgi:hypothetical protein
MDADPKPCDQLLGAKFTPLSSEKKIAKSHQGIFLILV